METEDSAVQTLFMTISKSDERLSLSSPWCVHVPREARQGCCYHWASCNTVPAYIGALPLTSRSGTAGFLFGGAAGIVKATTPFIFASVSGLQTFALGTTFWACRGTYLRMQDVGNLKPHHYTIASAASGALSGGLVALATRGRRNFIPATLMWSLIAGSGQLAYNTISVRTQSDQQLPTESFWKHIASKSWSPVKVMSDQEYAELLKEKMLKVDVDIAILDDKIAALKRQQEAEDAKSSSTFADHEKKSTR
ncbi:hypothetical protein EJ03DRAFT_328926 [Teratosphaeria nubilosa]|uniref:Uncharacterized protein n=1 Tax=Teratosphaeria nubilosa TaxID=161662 RepID=A0A6G1L663_9PEZI|nr:hypothetical protein EJ03DRAFT_328926 [Teratosphaeria nubilosa]